MIPVLPNEVNGAIDHLVRRGVKNTRSSRLRHLKQTKIKQDQMKELVMPRQRNNPWK